MGATTNHRRLEMRAERDEGDYPTGVTVSKEQLDPVPIELHTWLDELNYTIGRGHTGETTTT